MSAYIDIFDSDVDVLREYNAPDDALAGATVHIAQYSFEDYYGSSFVLFEKDGKLWEVNGSHCSCNGLEGQWAPEETTWEALAHILCNGTRFDGEIAAALWPLVGRRVQLQVAA